MGVDFWVWLIRGLVLAGAGVYLIVNAESVGEATGMIGHGAVDSPTPAPLVRFAGCVLNWSPYPWRR